MGGGWEREGASSARPCPAPPLTHRGGPRSQALGLWLGPGTCSVSPGPSEEEVAPGPTRRGGEGRRGALTTRRGPPMRPGLGAAGSAPPTVRPSPAGDRRPWKALSGGWPLRSPAAAGPAPPCPAAPRPPGPGAGSAVDVREGAGPPLAPPSKRHCRSLSEPDELARCRSPWRPGGGSKVWTAVSKRRCHSGGSASLPGPGSPPAPRPASARGGCSSGPGSGPGPPWAPPGPPLSARRRLSLSQEHLPDADGPSSAPALGWRLGLLRSRSQPCVLAGRKSRLKRPREEDPRWPRPSLDFLKMTRVRPRAGGGRPALLLPQTPHPGAALPSPPPPRGPGGGVLGALCP